MSFFQPVANGGSGIRKTRARFEELWNELSKDERSSIQWGVSPKEVFQSNHMNIDLLQTNILLLYWQVNFIKLFTETKDGSQSHFVEMLRRQILEEQVLLIVE